MWVRWPMAWTTVVLKSLHWISLSMYPFRLDFRVMRLPQLSLLPIAIPPAAVLPAAVPISTIWQLLRLHGNDFCCATKRAIRASEALWNRAKVSRNYCTRQACPIWLNCRRCTNTKCQLTLVCLAANPKCHESLDYNFRRSEKKVNCSQFCEACGCRTIT